MAATAAPRDLDELYDRVSAPSPHVVASLRDTEGDVLVLGAGGKMGLHLCLMLSRAFEELKKNNRVIAVSRFADDHARGEFEARGLATLPCDLSSAPALEALPSAAQVFYLAGVKFGSSGDPAILRRLNVEMPALVAKRFSQSALVALSTGCVYSFVSPESGGSTEADETDPVGDYAVSCLGRERAFAEASREFGTRVALVRLNYSVDLRYGVLVDIAQKVLAGEPVDVTMGYVNVVWQGDALSHIVQALAHAAAPPFIVNVAGARILRIREVASAFGERFHKEVTIQGSEAPTAWLSNAGKAHALFGVPAVFEDRLVEWVAAWIEGGGATLGKPTHFERRDGEY